MKNESTIIRESCLQAVCSHDACSTVLSPTQYVDGLIWLRDEIIKTVAPFAVRKEFVCKSSLARMFNVSAHSVDKVIKGSRIAFKRRPSGQILYSTRDFELAFKANNA